MSCPKTEHILQEYFSDDLAPLASEEIERHLSQCADCSRELEAMLLTQSQLQQWQNEEVPHWDRGLELFRREHRTNEHRARWFSWWQWGPTAATFAMLCLLVFNTSVSTSGEGVSISFGSSATNAALDEALAETRAQQQMEFDAMMVRFEERQDANNLQLMQALMAQTQQATADNLDRIFTYFEAQRMEDLQALNQSYQQLADSDYATIQSLQDLARFVSFQGSLP